MAPPNVYSDSFSSTIEVTLTHRHTKHNNSSNIFCTPLASAKTGNKSLHINNVNSTGKDQVIQEDLGVLYSLKIRIRNAIFHITVEFIWIIIMFFGRFVLWSINTFLDWFGPWFQLDYHLIGKSPHIGGIYATDGVTPPGKGVHATIDGTKYGPDHHETVEFVLPITGEVKEASVLYVHGGGWIAANSSCLIHSITPLVRSGYRCYSVNYPLAPFKVFPHAVISVLRSLSWLKKERKVNKILIFGDSAGGNLVTMAVAYISNPVLLRKLSDALPSEHIDTFDFPEILAVSSAYGIMDRSSWKQNIASTSALENFIYTFCLEFSHRCYTSPINTLDNQFNLVDIMHDIDSYPPLQLLCGDKDNLVHSNRLCHALMIQKGHSVDFHVYPGARHAFIGLPPQWIPEKVWKKAAVPAMNELIRFFDVASNRSSMKYE